MRIGLVSNPRSERNKKGMAELEAFLKAMPAIRHRPFEPGASFTGILRELAAEEVEILVCASGDGTVQGVLTSLLADRPFAKRPYLAILPRGMANMTAADCGLKGRGVDALERLLDAARSGRLEGHLAPRRVLKVDYSDDAVAPRGMFFGAAGIARAIHYCTGEMHTAGLKGEWSHAATLVSLLVGSMVKGLDAMGLEPHEVGIALDDETANGPPRRERLLLLLATTLERLVLGSRPFWNADSAPFRLTRIGHPPKGLLRHAGRVLYGGDRRRLPEDTYRSGGAVRARLWFDHAFTIDGEFFTPRPERPVVITADERVDFIRL